MKETEEYKIPFPEETELAKIPKHFKEMLTRIEKVVKDELLKKSQVEETASKLSLNIDESTYIMTLKLLDKNNNELDSKEIDFPIEQLVVDLDYIEASRSIEFTLKNGVKQTVSVESIVQGLVNTTQFNEALAKKVDKEEDKGLSTNDFTNEDKNKLTGIDEGAQVNTIEKIFINGVEQQIGEDKSVDIEIANTGVSQEYVDNLVGDINSILDEVNGEVI